MAIPTSPVNWYRGQVVFLTGGTGNVGGCMLYKLALQLPTEKIYVLCRGSTRQAIEKWEASMPEQIDEILDTGKVHCLIGDITQPNFGLGPQELEQLQDEVTIAIHAAADLSLFQELPVTIRRNTSPVIALARMLLSFQKIKVFLHISSIATQSFLQTSSVYENSDLVDPNEETAGVQLANILATGESPYTERFMAPYGQAKYLSEKLLLELNPPFPVLMMRPTSIGPAIRDPYPLYGPEGAIPLHTFSHLLIGGGEYRQFDDVKAIPREYIVDEIPVDLVTNTCLLHLAAGTTGIVHASSQLYTPVTFGEYVDQLQRYAPRSLVEKLVRVRLARNADLVSEATEILQSIARDWRIDCSRSSHLKSTEGPIGLNISDHDFENFNRARIERRARDTEAWVDSLNTPGL